MTKAGWLIWVPGMRGPEAQKCTDIPRSNANHKEYPLIGKFPLTEEEFGLCLNELSEIYPAPPGD